ncbi:3-hydroxybutyryl-CoA dehydrogenase [Cytobacillus depressus]|uniref:3-hydroxybutyryl-CoA dehydrogenase n=1 Tax=Cytobacillus depressus TaxID=1602942 RepID=A0A6L3V6E8_9BACI|nr:3-hydroxybutyryl-CoA dehydrogenase [Cytobacillus depressus]
MRSKRILVSGENALAKELFRSFKDFGFEHVFINVSSIEGNIDIAIETENIDLNRKKQNLKCIEEHVASSTPILTTSLRITATEAASWLLHPERIIGFGTFSNFKDGNLIEVASSLQSEPHYLNVVEALFSEIGLGIEVVEDEVGLVFPRILSLIINEAAFALTEGTASVQDIDEAMKKGTNYPMGPLEWAEKIGLEDVYAVLTGLYHQYGEERYRPSPLIRKLIHAGWAGGANERGFYYYQNYKAREYSICGARILTT